MPDIDAVWRRIEDHAGETFRLYQRGQITYHIDGHRLRHTGTIVPLYKRSFEKALEHVPLERPTDIRNLVTGSSYVYAILMDPRIRQQDW